MAWASPGFHGHVWGAVAYRLREAGADYRIVNPLATHRLREARQLDRDKRDVTNAEQIAELLRTGIVTETQLGPRPYLELRRLWGELARLRKERVRLKTLVNHQLYGLFPELVSNWKDIFAPGALALLRIGWTPHQMAAISVGELYQLVREHRQGRRLWRFTAHGLNEFTVPDLAFSSAVPAHLRRLVENPRHRLLHDVLHVLVAEGSLFEGPRLEIPQKSILEFPEVRTVDVIAVRLMDIPTQLHLPSR